MSISIVKNIKSLIPEIVWNPIWLHLCNTRKGVTKLIRSKDIVSGKWLDVGCGLRPYEVLFPRGCYIGVDIEVSGANVLSKKPDYYYNGVNLPFASNSLDGVLCTQVLEHVPNPSVVITEISRVLKQNGTAIISVPFVWQEHEVPFDFTRFSVFGIVKKLEQNGFDIEVVSKDTRSVETLAVLLNVYLINNLVPKIRSIKFIVNVLIILLLCFPIQIVALFLGKILPDEGRLYLNVAVKARKI